MNDEITTINELSGQLSQTQVNLFTVADELKRSQARNIVKNHVVAGGTMGLVPVPLFDIAALATNQHEMVRQLCRHYDVPASGGRIRLLLLSLLAGALPVVGVMALCSTSKFVPCIGTLGGSAGVGVIGGAITYATGRTFTKHFNAGGTLADFQPRQYFGFFRKEFDMAKVMFAEEQGKQAA